MASRSRSRPLAKGRRPTEAFVDTLVERLFGFQDGPLFDRQAVPQALLEQFMRSNEVRGATRDFALELGQLWTTRYPARPPLVLKGRQVVLTARPPEPPSPPMPPPAAPTVKIVFSAPNAKSGEPYRAVIGARTENGQAVRVNAASLPADIGLVFDPASGELHGTPLRAGDHTVALQWQDERGASGSGSFVLIVNANPRDLWKNIDADVSDPYFKPSEDARCIAASGQRIAAASKRGRSHAHVGSFRDDDFFIFNDAASGWSVLLVADGAGSAKSSRKGAALAAEKAGGHLVAELSGDEGPQIVRAIVEWQADATVGARPLKDRLYNLFGKAAWAALRAIEDEASSRSATVKDYATTLLCAIHRHDANDADGAFVASFWLGDGAICAYGPAGQARLMGKPDSGEFAGQTRFLDRAALSDPAALWERIEFGHHDALTSLMLMTDGISDPRFETDNGLADVAKWDKLWAELAPALADPAPERALLAWMDFLSPGHHDDRTLALLW